ncbi:TPA: biofilm peroxide resistance protein BsmA [Escherichia coli]|nr:biofilm peroxide resistance protein BsmA [Escherichia coli]OWD00808.1 bioflm peroxide resistance protein BsmA [Escherichia coli]RCQ00560.1 biofilm peroxide resistance protein BsmA [Escherichia coli]HAH2800286.1 biofilm peroxide resistance protein BsmA [Escherichia coli]HAI0817017.1 biofilm peroxide resistance protein BsmA [Escherichia coli]HAM4649075.1 biofilm peroxide resistance protein BsmA [Escherichia coli]
MVSRKRNSVIYRFASLLLVLMLSACSALQGTPQPAPPVTDHPQEIRRNQTQGLQRIGSVSTMVRGSPDDALAEIKAKAVAAKADYYVVVMVDETIVTGQWYSQAILYRKSIRQLT